MIPIPESRFREPILQVVKRLEDLCIARNVPVAGDGAFTNHITVVRRVERGDLLRQHKELRRRSDILIPYAGGIPNRVLREKAFAIQPPPGSRQDQQGIRVLGNCKIAVCGQLAAVPFLDRSVVIHNKAEVDDIGVCLCELCAQRVQQSRQKIVVAVKEKQVFALRAVDADVARVAESAVFLVDHGDAIRRFGGEQVAERAALAVCGAVVNEKDLIIVAPLRQNGAEAGFEIVLDVVYGNDDAEFHHDASALRRRSRKR